MCNHKIRRNYPFGKKSTPSMVCKLCGRIIKPKELEEVNKNKRKNKDRQNKNKK